MGANSNIEWTHHTFNPWRGCTKVSPGCHHCYAETLSGRNPKVLGKWGPKGNRVIAAESYWKEPLRWNKETQEVGERRRVFCASLADVFEGFDTMPDFSVQSITLARARLWQLIEATPSLDWLLLTKRPQNIMGFLPDQWQERLPDNIWTGTSVENQQAADERIPHLLRVPAKVRFLSCEPLLVPVDLSAWIWTHTCPLCRWRGTEPMEENICPACGSTEVGERFDFMQAGMFAPEEAEQRCKENRHSPIDWVIVGGESGPKARPMHPDWVRSIRDQCQSAGVAFHFKQWGEWMPHSGAGYEGAHFSVQTTKLDDDRLASKVGKKAAGRLLDGKTWDEMPEVKR